MTRGRLRALFHRIRAATEALGSPLATEDLVIQSMPEASPVKWHLAHTSWFFETFVLERALPGYRPLDPRYRVLFNSYYDGVGAQHPRAARGALSRPTVEEVLDYRRHVDRFMDRLFDDAPDHLLQAHALTMEVGLAHEEQHQELILTDIKHALSLNPLAPVYRARELARGTCDVALTYLELPGGVVAIGHPGSCFSFDNERPRHEVLLQPFALARRPVSCGEFLAFIADRGYGRSELWLSDGWAACQRQGWSAPLYWSRDSAGGWTMTTLAGPRPVDPREPVCHVSFYEADAFARWAGARLPREEEWELAASAFPVEGNFAESGRLHPRAADGTGAGQFFGDVWEWTASPYAAYPGFEPFAGTLGEYNGKFMCNQLVLRGGSCATPGRTARPSYRNFFPPDARWQFSGLRLARA